ncbi:MAG TPA: catalase family peroxidase [Bryobacteraceae bacterium]
MSPKPIEGNVALAKDLLEAFDKINGPQPGYRAAHAKGILLSGTFTPSPAAKTLTRAPHLQRDSTPVSVRFSDSTGIPVIPDNHPQASPRGCAIRFHLAEHVHTDIIGHTVDGFPTRTAEEFLEFLHAVQASGPDAVKPTPVEKFLGSHPAALAFVQAPKPMAASFTKTRYFGVNAFQFTNKDGVSQYGRYRIRPEGSEQYLDAGAEAKTTPNFLFDEIRSRLVKGPAKLHIAVQIAAKDDVVNDATVHWPSDRREIAFGTVEIRSEVANNDAEQRQIIFDPIPRVDGIGPSGDPLLDPRATIYLMSGRRRRAEGPK